MPFTEPRGTLLIVDRTFDMVSPLIHDYHYQSMVYDYLDIGENGSLNHVLPPQKSNVQQQAASETEHKLNEYDSIWSKYRCMHIAEVLGQLGEDIQALQKEQRSIKKVADKKEMHNDEISNLLKRIPEFEEKKTKVLIHYELAQKVSAFTQNEEYNILRLIELEQTIISGVDHEATPILEGAIAKQVRQTAKRCGRPMDVVRLLAIYLNCYAIPKAD